MISVEQARKITDMSVDNTDYVFQLQNIYTDILYACCRGKTEIIVGEQIHEVNKKILVEGGYELESSCEQEKDAWKHRDRYMRDEYKTIISWGE